jgi:uncharacterized protein (TIGR02118 family)
MVKLTVLYNQPEDAAAFDAYYLGTHVPLANKLPGLRKNEVAKVVGEPGAPLPPYHLIAELYFDDAEALQAALASEEGQATAGDLANFAGAGVTILVAEVLG